MIKYTYKYVIQKLSVPLSFVYKCMKLSCASKNHHQCNISIYKFIKINQFGLAKIWYS